MAPIFTAPFEPLHCAPSPFLSFPSFYYSVISFFWVCCLSRARRSPSSLQGPAAAAAAAAAAAPIAAVAAAPIAAVAAVAAAAAASIAPKR